MWCINISAVMPASLYSQVHQSSVGAGTGGFTLPASSEITMDPGGGGRIIDARGGGGGKIEIILKDVFHSYVTNSTSL